MTPAIFLDPSRGVFKMRGRSSPENSVQFYEPIINILANKINAESVDVRIKMEYFNTSSSKCIYDILKGIKRLKNKGKKVMVRWYYEADDEDMLEAGEDYSDFIRFFLSKFVEFTLGSVPEECLDLPRSQYRQFEVGLNGNSAPGFF